MLKISLSQDFIDSTAPDINTIIRGWKQARNHSFMKLNISQDGTAIFGECVGSEGNMYKISADFIRPDSPVFRCNCRIRQRPCKHILGLMYSYIDGKKFDVGEIPEDILKERKKAEKQEKGKKSDAKKKRKPNKAALVKKMQSQLEGLELLDKITCSILQGGFGTINEKFINLLNKQEKELGNYYIPGAQIDLRRLIALLEFSNDCDANSAARERAYTKAFEWLTTLYAFSKKGKEYLMKRLDDPEVEYTPDLTLDGWLGYTWQLADLKEAGFVETNVDLVQLSFCAYADYARQEYVDEGIWLNLGSGQLMLKLNYVPFKAVKRVSRDDSVFSAVHTEELYIYPGDLNPRVRWKDATMRPLTDDDYSVVRAHASGSFNETIKIVKDQIKNPISNKNPVALLHYKKIGRVGDSIVLEDAEGQRLIIADKYRENEPRTVRLIELLDPNDMEDQVMLVRFHHDLYAKRLYVKPLSIVREKEIIRLSW